MKQEDIFWNLCTKDPRHPLFPDVYGDEDSPPTPREKGCCCDSCFYGRDRLAMEILKLQEQLKGKV